MATLMAGVIGTESYGLDDRGQVFLLDAKGKLLEPPVSESIAASVREAIERDDLATIKLSCVSETMASDR